MLVLHAALDQSSPAADATERVPVRGAVPASYSLIAKEVRACAMKLILRAAGSTAAWPELFAAITSALHAVHNCASFRIRCARADEAASTCVTELNLLHTGGRSSMSALDYLCRENWTDVPHQYSNPGRRQIKVQHLLAKGMRHSSQRRTNGKRAGFGRNPSVRPLTY
jgi:hypothetical protein